jgi:hypothetical protein
MKDNEKTSEFTCIYFARERMWESDKEALALPRWNIVFTIAGRLQFSYAVIRHYAPGCGIHRER